MLPYWADKVSEETSKVNIMGYGEARGWPPAAVRVAPVRHGTQSDGFPRRYLSW